MSISVSRPRRVCFSVFSGLCLSVCQSRPSCVRCLLCLLSVPWRLLLSCVGLGCLVLSYLGLSCLVLSACHRSVFSHCDFRLVECLPLPAIHLHMVLFHILRVHAAICAVAFSARKSLSSSVWLTKNLQKACLTSATPAIISGTDILMPS